MADTKVTALTENTTPALTDLLMIVDDPGGTALSQKITIANLGEGINPMTTEGDVIYGGASGVLTRLAAGTAGHVLTMGASVPAWAAPSAGGAPYQVLLPLLFPSAAGGTPALVKDDSEFSNFSIYTSNQNEYMEYPVFLAAGTWKLDVYCKIANTRAIATVSIDGSNVGTFDEYAAVAAGNTLKTIAGITVATAGVKLLRFTAATRHASSSGYVMLLSMAAMTRTGA